LAVLSFQNLAVVTYLVT